MSNLEKSKTADVTHKPVVDVAQPTKTLSNSERILLESACVDVIGGLEQLIEKAGIEREAGFLGESANVGNKMLLSLVDFSEGYLVGDDLDSVYTELAEGYKATRKTIDLAASQRWGTLRKLAGRASASDLQVAEAHRDAGFAIASAAEFSIRAAIARLDQESSISKQLVASLEPILVELRERW